MESEESDATGNKEHISMSGYCRPLPSKQSKVPFEPLIPATEDSTDTLSDEVVRGLLSSLTDGTFPVERFLTSYGDKSLRKTEGSEQDKRDLEEFYEKKNRALTKSFNKDLRKFKLRMLWIKYKKLLNIAIPSYAFIVLCLLSVNVYVPLWLLIPCPIIVNGWGIWKIVKIIRSKR